MSISMRRFNKSHFQTAGFVFLLFGIQLRTSADGDVSISGTTVTDAAPLAEQRAGDDAGHPTDKPESNPVAIAPAVAPIKTTGGNEWVIVPIPSYNPSQKFEIQGMAQYIFHTPDEPAGTPPSVLGLAAFYTEKDSWGILAGYMGHVKKDQWRPAFGGGYVDYRYDYYGNGNEAAALNQAIEVRQRGAMAFGRLMYRVYKHIYVGIGGMANQTRITVDATLPPGVSVPDKIKQFVIGPVAQWDSRDNQFFPTQGTLANLRLDYVGGDYSYAKFELDWNRYLSFDALPHGVLALRAAVRYVGNGAPFFALSQFGSQNDLRGYISGKYRDNALLSAQVEWRQQLAKRWIAAVFAGMGEVEHRLTELRANDVLSSAGLGIRYRVGTKNPVSLRLDWAYGKDGGAWYFTIGEAY